MVLSAANETLGIAAATGIEASEIAFANCFLLKVRHRDPHRIWLISYLTINRNIAMNNTRKTITPIG
jgi:hypothetical protein|tara:strand:- start:177 stop:377 length:201 start_codon:yes stop_codon:yes gene_type:complete